MAIKKPASPKDEEIQDDEKRDDQLPRAERPVRFFAPASSGLILYHEGQKVAAFEGGYFETTDPAIAAILRELEHCMEILPNDGG